MKRLVPYNEKTTPTSSSTTLVIETSVPSKRTKYLSLHGWEKSLKGKYRREKNKPLALF
jgi:hypothetical protein